MPWIFLSEALEMVIVKPWVPRATLMGWEMPMCAPRSAVRVSLTAHGVFCDLGWWVWGTASLFSAGAPRKPAAQPRVTVQPAGKGLQRGRVHHKSQQEGGWDSVPKSELTLPWRGSTVRFVPAFFSPLSLPSAPNSSEKALPKSQAPEHFSPPFPTPSAPEETPGDL